MVLFQVKISQYMMRAFVTDVHILDHDLIVKVYDTTGTRKHGIGYIYICRLYTCILTSL
jgi:hypothetical protein